MNTPAQEITRRFLAAVMLPGLLVAAVVGLPAPPADAASQTPAASASRQTGPALRLAAGCLGPDIGCDAGSAILDRGDDVLEGGADVLGGLPGLPGAGVPGLPGIPGVPDHSDLFSGDIPGLGGISNPLE